MTQLPDNDPFYQSFPDRKQHKNCKHPQMLEIMQDNWKIRLLHALALDATKLIICMTCYDHKYERC